MGQRGRFLGNIPEKLLGNNPMGKMGLQWIEYRKYSGEKNTQEMSQKYQTRLRKIEGKGLRGTKHNTAPDVREALENPQQRNPLVECIFDIYL